MIKTTYVNSIQDFEEASELGLRELILCPKEISRFGKLSREDINSIAQEANQKDIKVYIEWDIISTEADFSEKVLAFEAINKSFYQAIRVQDTGVLNYLLDKTDRDIHLILEGSNHNLEAIKAWENLCGDRLKRLVLSIELSKEVITEYAKELKTPIELLVLGRILLFYTPRNLLSALKPQEDEQRRKQVLDNDFIEALGESEESPHKGFPLVENSHGTFMFHIKRLNLLKHIAELSDMGVAVTRYDFRFDDKGISSDMLNNDQAGYSYDSIKGFFNINKSDVLFKKLKNYRIQRKDESYIGEVLEISSKSFIALKVKKGKLSVRDRLSFITPDGKEKFFDVKSLRDTALNDVTEISAGGIAVLTYLSGITVKSQAYLS